MKPQPRRESARPVVDEAAFQQLLSAAYVMQEHNSRLKKAPSQPTQGSTPATVAAIATEASIPAQPVPVVPQSPVTGLACQECGAALALNEFFCENCGAPAERPNNTMQKNWASLWEMHQASQTEIKDVTPENKASFASAKSVESEEGPVDEEIVLFPAELEEIVGKFDDPESDEKFSPDPAEAETSVKALSLVPAHSQGTKAEITNPQDPSAWTSAAKARAWLDSLTPGQKSKEWFREEWNFHRGMISIALASAVLLAVLFQWVTRPSSTPSQGRELSAFEQMLVSVGLAEAPSSSTPATQPGNPSTKVWVDVHTALYYCPGADLYGKTANGKYTTQLDAQRDNFQPSTLKACD